MNYHYITQSKTGLIRSENEDSLGVFNIHNGLLVVLCDGLGGNNAGEVASRLTVDSISGYFKESFNSNITETIKSAIKNADIVLRLKASENSALTGMSTTAEVLFLTDNKVYTGHIGDSRTYLFADNKLIQLTKDHSFVQRLIDDGVLTPDEAEAHPHRHIITKALGDVNPAEADINIINLEPGKSKFLFTCTDGVTGVISNEELEEIFTSNSFENLSETISDLIEDRGAPDNYSFVIVKME